MAFTAPIFHETRPSLDRCFVDISCFNFFSKSDEKYRKYEHNFSEVKAYCEHIFMKIATAFNGIVCRSPTPHRISSKSAKTNERYR